MPDIHKVIVTGGCGFIGSEVVKQLAMRGLTLRVIDDLSKPESSVARLPNVEFVQQDLTDMARTRVLFEGFDACVNLAAKIGGIGYFHKYPATILSENNRIYSSTFMAAAQHRFKRMLYVSSSMVFESTTRFPSKESDLIEIPVPISAYGFSKLVGEWYCKAFKDEYGLPYTICRPFNAYGINEAPGEEVGYAHVIPDLVKKCLLQQEPLELLGDGQQTRCFTHVSDIADGICTALLHPAAENEDFNISTSEETRIEDLARRIYRAVRGKEPGPFKYVPGFKHDIRRRIPDTSKAKRLLGWEAKVPLQKGLPEVIDWIRQNYGPERR